MLDESEKPNIDPDFEEATEGEEIEHKESLKTKWAQLEAVVGAGNRVTQIAQDLVAHFEDRLEAMDGKAMIVCMSRRICVELHEELVRLRPDWYDEDDSKGQIKVVMTGSATDPPTATAPSASRCRRRATATLPAPSAPTTDAATSRTREGAGPRKPDWRRLGRSATSGLTLSGAHK